MSFWAQAMEIARVDLRVERRLGDTLRIVLPFAVVALIVFPLALGGRPTLISRIGPAVFWALGALFGMQVALRASATETAERRDLHALLGVDPAARFAGRTISGAALVLTLLAALFPAMALLYGPDLPDGAWPATLVASALFSIGLAELGTLAGEVTAGLRNRAPLASLIVAPLCLPLVIGASQALEALSRGAGILPWTLLMLATVLALAVAGVGLARPLEEATR